VRELKNTMERAVLLAEGGSITAEHVLLGGAKMPSVSPVDGAASDERQRILDALAKTNGNQTRAAELLGISRRALVYRMEIAKISGPQKQR
jgi:sigma-54-dependent transcriptional regulator